MLFAKPVAQERQVDVSKLKAASSTGEGQQALDVRCIRANGVRAAIALQRQMTLKVREGIGKCRYDLRQRAAHLPMVANSSVNWRLSRALCAIRHHPG